VPAVVEGLLDLHFYDFTFQREVQVEGGTTSTWNKWTRNTDRSNEDNPSPKKARRGEGKSFQQGSSSQSQEEGEQSSQEYGRRHDKQTGRAEPLEKIDEESDKSRGEEGGDEQKKEDMLDEKGKTIEKDKETIEDDSDDSGPYFDDILSPGGTHMTFGDFHNMEIKNIFRMQMNEKYVAVNEYGTNLVKYKYDPLAVIEAKIAMTHGKGCCDKISPAIEGEAEGEVGSVHLTQPSPRTGTQEAPEAVWSSQEVNGEESDIDKEGKLGKQQENQQSPNWEKLEEFSEDQEIVTQKSLNGESKQANVGEELKGAGKESLIEKEKEAMANTASMEHNQTRQSQRVKEQGLQGIKIAEKAVLAAQKKNLEGNHTNFRNSFAVLNNSDLADRAGKMGVNTVNVVLEKFDILRELEHARNNLVEKLNHVEGA
jgi:hypothetical protein